MAEDRAIYNKGKELFDALMGYMDSFIEENDRKKGLLYYVKDSRVAGLTVTKSVKKQTSVSYKAFFLNKVLNLHDGGAELNYKVYEDYYKANKGQESEEKNKAKKNKKEKLYRMDSKKLILYWGQKTNDDFFDVAEKQTSNGVSYVEVMKQDRRYPYFFFTHLLKITMNCLQEYFNLDMEKSAVWEKTMPPLARKRRGMYTKEELYARFVMAASLYEKFGEKFLGDSIEKFVEQVKVIEQRKMTKEDTLLLLARKAWVNHYTEYQRYLDAFCAIIYLIEFHNVNCSGNAVPEKIKSAKLEVAFQEALSEISSQFLMDNENKSMNKAAREVYEKFMEQKEQQKLLSELCGTSEKNKEKALQRIQNFMCTVSENTDLGSDELHKAVMEIAKNCLFQPETE